jgi:hypothetical protein
MPDDEESPRASSPIPPLELDSPSPAPSFDFTTAERKIRPRSRLSSRASSPPPPAASISSLQNIHAEGALSPKPDDGVYHGVPSQFTLKTGGSTHVFELSLCGSEEFQQLDKVLILLLHFPTELTFSLPIGYRRRPLRRSPSHDQPVYGGGNDLRQP